MTGKLASVVQAEQHFVFDENLVDVRDTPFEHVVQLEWRQVKVG